MHRILALLVITGCVALDAALAAEEPQETGKVSRHVSDMIQAGFRQESGPVAPVDKPAPPDATVPTEIEPGVVAMPKFEVKDRPAPAKLDQAALTPKTEAVPLVAGTGVTEFRGKKLTVLVRTFLFIPIGFKIEW